VESCSRLSQQFCTGIHRLIFPPSGPSMIYNRLRDTKQSSAGGAWDTRTQQSMPVNAASTRASDL
jgi:hypothetical protein